MKHVRWIALLLTASLLPAAAQSPSATPQDIQGLQDAAFEATNDVGRLRTGDAALRTELSTQLEDIREEIVYLKVKLRKREPVGRSDVRAVNERIDGIRRRARGPETVTAAGLPPNSPAPSQPQARLLSVPAGTEVDVRTLTSLSSRTARSGDRVEAATVRHVSVGGGTVIPAGALVRGEVTVASQGTSGGQLSVRFDELTFDYYTHAILATPTRLPVTQGNGAVELKMGTIVRLRFGAPR